MKPCLQPLFWGGRQAPASVHEWPSKDVCIPPVHLAGCVCALHRPERDPASPGRQTHSLHTGTRPEKLWSSGVPQWWRKATAASKTPRSKTTGAAVSFNRARSACASSSASAKKAERFCQGLASLPAACAAAITRRPGSGTVVIPRPASASINVDFPPPEHPVRRNLCIMRSI